MSPRPSPEGSPVDSDGAASPYDEDSLRGRFRSESDAVSGRGDSLGTLNKNVLNLSLDPDNP